MFLKEGEVGKEIEGETKQKNNQGLMEQNPYQRHR